MHRPRHPSHSPFGMLLLRGGFLDTIRGPQRIPRGASGRALPISRVQFFQPDERACALPRNRCRIGIRHQRDDPRLRRGGNDHHRDAGPFEPALSPFPSRRTRPRQLAAASDQPELGGVVQLERVRCLSVPLPRAPGAEGERVGVHGGGRRSAQHRHHRRAQRLRVAGVLRRFGLWIQRSLGTIHALRPGVRTGRIFHAERATGNGV